MFWTMLLSRRTDERAWVLHRQGKIAFHISGIGQEAAQVGAAFAIKRGYNWVSPYYRDLALMLAMGLTPLEFLLGVMGKKGEPSSGARQMPSHWGLRRANVLSRAVRFHRPAFWNADNAESNWHLSGHQGGILHPWCPVLRSTPYRIISGR